MEEIKIRFNIRNTYISKDCKDTIELIPIDGNKFNFDLAIGEDYAK